MLDAIDVAGRIMADELFRLNVVSQNLANATTAGYKGELVVSRPFVEQLQMGMPVSGASKVLSVSMPALTSVLDTTQGTLTRTGNALDVALEGPGFFEVQGADGPLYTRQGSFRLDATGRLVTAGGMPVAGLGGDIVLRGTEPTIDAQGRVLEGDQAVGQLKVMRFRNASALAPIGQGLYRADSAGDVQSDALQVRQGFVESSNAAALPQMIRMIELVRRFEAAQKLVQNYDGMLGTAIRTLGEF